MNILQILPELNVGGVETGTIDLAKYLVRSSHKVVVVSCGGELVKELEAINVKHYQLPVHKKSLFTIIRMIKCLTKIIQDENIEIVHARSRVPAWIAFFACRKTGVRFITTCHGYYCKHFFSRVMSWANLVIVPSNIIARHMIEDFGLPLERIRLIPRGVDLERFRFQGINERKKPYLSVGIIGRITPLKGHTYFLKAMHKVVRVLPYLKIWIVGNFPKNKENYKEEVHTLVKRLGLSSYVEFLENRRDIPEILSQLDCLVLSTITHEAFGRVILEAQAVGVPVIATRIGGVVDIIDDGLTGILVTPRNSEEIAEAVIKILKDAKLAKTLTINARKKIEEKFTLERMAKQTLAVYQELKETLNILVIKISSMGDVILSTPSLRAIRKKFPLAKIYGLSGKESCQILQRCPYIDGLICFDHKDIDKGIKGILNISSQLRRYNFDIVLDLQNNRKSHLISFLSMAAKRYGYDNGKFSFLLNYRIKDRALPLAPVDHQAKTLELLGINLTDKHLELWPSREDDAYIKNILEGFWLKDVKDIVGINLASSKRWLSKTWPIENVSKLCDNLASKNMRVVITGSQDEISLASRLMKKVKSKPANLVAKTNLIQLASLIKRCAAYVSADSAPLHIAAAMDTPIVALFGPTSALKHLPPAKKLIVLKKDLDCSPCYKPNCKDNRCMKLITPEEVMSAIEKLIS